MRCRRYPLQRHVHVAERGRARDGDQDVRLRSRGRLRTTMAKRALIVAIEGYAAITEGLARQLPGTLAGALEFRSWLIEEQGVAAADIYFCTEADSAARTA